MSMEEESKLKLMSDFTGSFYHSLQIIERERKAKLANDMEASDLQQKLHHLERQLEEDRISRCQEIHVINTQIDGLKNCSIKKDSADFNSAMAATISKDLKLIKEETRNICIENLSIKKELERRDLHAASDNSVTLDREKGVDRMANTLATERLQLKEDLLGLQVDIESVRSRTGSNQAIGLKFEQEIKNLVSQCEDLETEKLKLGVDLAQIKSVADRITADDNEEKTYLRVSNLELQLARENRVEEKLKHEFDKLQKDKDTMECLTKNANIINKKIESVRQEGNKRQVEIQNIMDEMEIEENKWLEEKNVLKLR